MSSGEMDVRATQSPAVRSPQQMRDRNMAVMLNLFWDAPSEAAFTASELVESTGLTRPTVLAVCSDLREMDWVLEDRAPTATPGRGRQARRFTFNRSRVLVAAVDVGIRSVTAVVADLSGAVLGRAQHSFQEKELWATDRTDHVIDALEEAVRRASVDSSRICHACFGVAAPVTPRGIPFPGDDYWDLVSLDLPRLAAYAPEWTIEVHNDADLAALAELHAAGDGAASPSITLLAGERLGAGIMINGAVLRGANGGAGEMGYLEHVIGVENSLGLVATARELVKSGSDDGRESVLSHREISSIEELLDAADAGDALAGEVRDDLVEKLVMVIFTLSSVIDPATVTIAGGVADQATPLVPDVQSRLATLLPFPPRITTSSLGRDVVLLGAVRNAVDSLRRTAL